MTSINITGMKNKQLFHCSLLIVVLNCNRMVPTLYLKAFVAMPKNLPF